MDNLNKALNYIISIDNELEAITILLKSHNAKYEKLCKDYSFSISSLNAIHKINASNNRDKKSAIAALSELKELEKEWK